MDYLPEAVQKRFSDSTIGDYTITGVIGEGGQGVVLQLSNGDGRLYTGKVIDRRFSLSGDIPELQGVRRGIELSDYLDHPSVQTVQEVVEFDGPPSYFVVVKEYAEGRSLKEILEEKGTLTADELEPILQGAVNALEYLHDASQHPKVGTVCHRDIKPEHIIVGDDGHVTLIDMDTSRSTGGMTTRFTAAGTKSYQSPEALLGSTSTDGDFYALGFTAIEALLGKVPEELSDSRLPGKPAYTLPDEIGPSLKYTIEQMVHPEQERRIHSADQFRSSLETSLQVARQGNLTAQSAMYKLAGIVKDTILLGVVGAANGAMIGAGAQMGSQLLGINAPIELMVGYGALIGGGLFMGIPALDAVKKTVNQIFRYTVKIVPRETKQIEDIPEYGFMNQPKVKTGSQLVHVTGEEAGLYTEPLEDEFDTPDWEKPWLLGC